MASIARKRKYYAGNGNESPNALWRARHAMYQYDECAEQTATGHQKTMSAGTADERWRSANRHSVSKAK